MDTISTLELSGERTPVPQLLRELWEHRSLLTVLARQHFQGQYRAARLGVAWTAIQPLTRGAILAVVFTVFVPVETDVPYPAFILGGSATWAFVAGAVTSGTLAVVTTGDLAAKVYFPRLLLPPMPALATLPGYVAALGVVIIVSTFFGAPPGAEIVYLPVAVLLCLALTTSIASVTSLLHVHYRDVGHMMTNGIQVLYFLTPVIYPSEAAGRYAGLLHVNPLAGAVGLVRWSLFGGDEPLAVPLAYTIGWTVLMGTIGIRAYSRYDRVCVDRL